LVGLLIGLLLVFACQKLVLDVRDKMAEFIVLLRKEIKDSLTRRRKERPPQKRTGRKGRKGTSTSF